MYISEIGSDEVVDVLVTRAGMGNGAGVINQLYYST